MTIRLYARLFNVRYAQQVHETPPRQHGPLLMITRYGGGETFITVTNEKGSR